MSPLLANLYLDPLDRQMAEEGHQMVRYADDKVVQCRSREEAETALSKLAVWVAGHGLTLHPEQTRVVDASERGGIDFLGCHVERGKKWSSERKLRETIRAKTGRKVSGSVDQIIAGMNPVVRGWCGYFKQSHWTTFGPLDRWIRMRLWSILRRRRKGQGRGRGADHQRWPNAYCVRHGLFTMQTARLQAIRTLAVQSR